jgi:hypothetical protein
MEEILNHFPELMLGIVLGGFAWAFKNWSGTIERTSDKIIGKMELLTTAFNEYRIRTENRVTKVEAQVAALEKRLDVCAVKSKNEENQPKDK